MPSEVYTCAEFSACLPTILQRHLEATTLLLQLSPVSAPSEVKLIQQSFRDDADKGTTTKTSWPDDRADFVTIYGVFLKAAGSSGDSEQASPYHDPSWVATDGNACIDDVCIIIGHASSITLRWCAQLQHALSVTFLLMSASDPNNQGITGNYSFSENQKYPASTFYNPRISSSATVGVTGFLVRLSPFVSPLQWDRHVDGVLGSPHFVCGSHRCLLPGSAFGGETSERKCKRSGTHEVAWCDDEGIMVYAAAAAASAAGEHRYVQHRVEVPPLQRSKYEVSCSLPQNSFPSLPFRVAAVLNGSAPLPQRPVPRNSICVLCLVACDGCSLTATSGATNATTLTYFGQTNNKNDNAFDCLCDFIEDAVIPRVCLGVVGGTWARSEAGNELQRDVCKVRGKLGGSYAIQLSQQDKGSTEQRVRSIVFVVDFSTPLLNALMSWAKTASLLTEEARTELRCCLASQVAAAVQETLGQLVSANIDAFSFPSSIKNANSRLGESGLDSSITQGLAAGDSLPTTRSAQLTSEMLCRSIAESVSHIVSLSSSQEFRAEVVRLLWGGGPSESFAAANVNSARTLPSTSAIQRRIEECLLSSVNDK